MNIPPKDVMTSAYVLFATAFIVALVTWLTPNSQPREYGCEKVYKLPPVWRCGEFGDGFNNSTVAHPEAWVSSDDFYIGADLNVRKMPGVRGAE